MRDTGDLLDSVGQRGAAQAAWQQALAAFDELGDPQAEDLRARVSHGH